MTFSIINRNFNLLYPQNYDNDNEMDADDDGTYHMQMISTLFYDPAIVINKLFEYNMQ